MAVVTFWFGQCALLAYGALMLHRGVYGRRPLRAIGGGLIVTGTAAVMASEVAFAACSTCLAPIG
jgi:hypothetical protein